MSPLFNDTEDDVSLPQRGDSRDGPGRSVRELDHSPADREFTLNTGVVLALFFALALLCAVFFGFGYSIGHKAAPPPVAGSDSAAPVPTPVAASTSNIKPSPGTAAVPEYVPSSSASTTATRPASATPAPSPRETASAAPTVTAPVSRPAPVVRVPTPPVELPAIATPAYGGTTYVQVAAVSHPEDADVLLSSLRRRGYTVLTRSDANDHLIHVQIGPFLTRKDADVMRQKLLGDGYNAILK